MRWTRQKSFHVIMLAMTLVVSYTTAVLTDHFLKKRELLTEKVSTTLRSFEKHRRIVEDNVLRKKALDDGYHQYETSK